MNYYGRNVPSMSRSSVSFHTQKDGTAIARLVYDNTLIYIDRYLYETVQDFTPCFVRTDITLSKVTFRKDNGRGIANQAVTPDVLLDLNPSLLLWYKNYYRGDVTWSNVVESGSDFVQTQKSLPKGYVSLVYPTGSTYFRVGHVFRLMERSITTTVRTEDEACYRAREFDLNNYDNRPFIFDFERYRFCDLDILDLERTGRISSEEGYYHMVKRYAENAWYIIRYGLEGYCRENHIPIGSYRLDENGYMIHPITGKKLSPV